MNGDNTITLGDQRLGARGEMAQRTAAFNWSQTPLGAMDDWPRSLHTALRIMLGSRYAMWLGWGADFTFFYNDAYAKMTLGPKHPWALGRSAREVWSEIWPDVGPRAESVLSTGQATWDEGLLLFLERRGFAEETYHTFSYSPLPDDEGRIGGMLCVVTEDTERTIAERRLRTLRELAARTTEEAKSVDDACQTASRILGSNPRDVPFALLYLLDGDGRRARLAALCGIERDAPASPSVVDLHADETAWPLAQAAATGQAIEVGDLVERFGPLPGGAWPESTRRAVVLPMAKPGQSQWAGFLAVGVSPRLDFNEGYKGFFDLLAGHLATAVANARAYEEERLRAESLAELDRAKTAFFSNVSHEFRTPLTLMLGPVEELLDRSHTDLSPAAAEQLDVVNRNGLRLLRLVNTLLDFSRIEAGRVRAIYQPTDLAVFTADLASNFRSVCERAGLNLLVDCEPLGEPAFVDRQMWEKIVLNLLSNAFKFTFEGEIAVTLRRDGESARLSVRDTGTGIPTEEMPRLFERFHRVEQQRGRTHEGSGIGLALVQELVKLHGGAVAVESEVGQGTNFTVALPLGSAHLPPDQVGASPLAAPVGAGAGPFIEEALRWLPDAASRETPPAKSDEREPDEGDARPRLLVADDNADMRQYVARLLKGAYRVEAAADGVEALTAARSRPPALVLSDVMMPRMDGFELLRELRADPATSEIPVILLSARAGEESRMEGIEAGADDYLVKPFSASELMARVAAHLQMARLRRESNDLLRAREAELLEAQRLAHVGSWKWDAATDATTGSDELFRIYGLDPATRDFPDFQKQAGVLYPPESWRRIDEAARETMQSGVGYRLDLPALRKGEAIWVTARGEAVRDELGAVIGLRGTVQDITHQRRAEQALRDSEAHFRSMPDNTAALLWVTDASGYCTFISRQWCDFTGTTVEQNIGFGWLDRVHPKDLPPAKVAFLLANENHSPLRIDYRLRRSDGEYRWALDAGLPRFDDGVFAGFVGCVFDVHDRKLGEEALREADRKKDEFLSILAHELRNPLAPLRNGLQVMKLAAGDATAVEQARAMMERQLRQMVHLIDDLMDLTRISRGKVALQTKRMRLDEALQSALDASRPLIEQEEHELSLAFPEKPVHVVGDETRLSQIFANLLNNAAKYTPRGGRIAVTGERRGSDVVVTVEDNGLGIPPPMLPKVFEMFTQVDRSLEKSQGGLGIGLCIVKRLVEMHGGEIWAESEGDGRGSRFRVKLPLAPAPAEDRAGADDGLGNSTKRRILVVDDNRDAAVSLAMMLEIMGNETATAHDGLEAIAAAESFRPDVALLDIGMPRLNGYDACRRIRQESWGKGILLVACTGWGQDEDKRKAREAGFDHHLVKPLDPLALERLLQGLTAAST